jgi:hypothetical protein
MAELPPDCDRQKWEASQPIKRETAHCATRLGRLVRGTTRLMAQKINKNRQKRTSVRISSSTVESYAARSHPTFQQASRSSIRAAQRQR